MVEWKKLGDFAMLQKTKNRKHVTENAYSITQAGLVPTKSFFKEKTNITSNDTSGYYIVEKEWFVYSPSRIDVGSISYLKDEGPVIVSPIDVVFSIDKTVCLPSFLLNYFFTYQGRRDLLRNREGVEGTGRISLPFSAIQNMLIPVPLPQEQKQILKKLDTFTSSIENLKEQIAQRRKQYEYYRDQLLDFEGKEGVEMKTLGDICTIKNGYTPSTKNSEFWDGGSLPWFTLEDIRKKGRILDDSIKHITALGVKKGGLFPANSIIISTTATIGEYALIQTDFLCNQQISCLSIKDTNIVLPKYLYYLAPYIGEWCKKNVNGGGSLLIVSTSKLQKIRIPLPPLSEQQRIVSILDTFEASVRNLEQQLAQREKQYEYYRNKLLTFE